MSGEIAPATPAERDGLVVIRRRRFLNWSVFLTYLPAGWLVLQFTQSERVFMAVAGIWMAAFAASALAVAFSRCPRCRKPFHHQGVWSNTWTRNCLNCSLPLRPPENESPAR